MAVGPLPPISNIIPDAQFLFGVECGKYLHKIVEKSVDLWLINENTKHNGKIMLPGDIDKHIALLLWFHEQATGGAMDFFRPFLGFEEWR